jgi:hypothetical protein
MPWRKRFPTHEIGRIDGGRGFQTGKNVFRIGRNTFYDRENKIPMKNPEFKRSEIGLIMEFRGIPNGFPNQDVKMKRNHKQHFANTGEYTCCAWAGGTESQFVVKREFIHE